jgi:hypothetical protein
LCAELKTGGCVAPAGHIYREFHDGPAMTAGQLQPAFADVADTNQYPGPTLVPVDLRPHRCGGTARFICRRIRMQTASVRRQMVSALPPRRCGRRIQNFVRMSRRNVQRHP